MSPSNPPNPRVSVPIPVDPLEVHGPLQVYEPLASPSRPSRCLSHPTSTSPPSLLPCMSYEFAQGSAHPRACRGPPPVSGGCPSFGNMQIPCPPAPPLPPLEMRPSSIAPNPAESREALPTTQHPSPLRGTHSIHKTDSDTSPL